MSVGGIRVKFYIFDSFSLKEKRKILRSIKDRLKNKFGVSVAETDDHNDHRYSTFDIALAAKNLYNLNILHSKIRNFFEEEKEIEILEFDFFVERT
jgi:hypothetical protein